MTPILRNRHEKVQEATINLIGRIGKSFRDPFSTDADTFPKLIVALSSSLLVNGCESVSSCLIC